MNPSVYKDAVAYDPVTLEIKGRIDGQGGLFPGAGTLTKEADTAEEIDAFIASEGLRELASGSSPA